MKQLCTVVLLGIIFSVTTFSQEYQWVQKQSGSSLGGPIDYLTANPDVVYYGSNNKIWLNYGKIGQFWRCPHKLDFPTLNCLKLPQNSHT